MSRRKLENPYLRKVVTTVAAQYLYEARQSNMNLSEYISWLKSKAGITTAYDLINAKLRAEETAKRVNIVFEE